MSMHLYRACLYFLLRNDDLFEGDKFKTPQNLLQKKLNPCSREIVFGVRRTLT